MGFQAAVKTDPAIGIPGQEVNPRQAVYTAFNYVSDGTVPAGGFAFAALFDTPAAPTSDSRYGKATSAPVPRKKLRRERPRSDRDIERLRRAKGRLRSGRIGTRPTYRSRFGRGGGNP